MPENIVENIQNDLREWFYSEKDYFHKTYLISDSREMEIEINNCNICHSCDLRIREIESRDTLFQYGYLTSKNKDIQPFLNTIKYGIEIMCDQETN